MLSPEIKEKLQTGDILLFEHHSNFHGIINTILTLVNKFVSIATDSKYSHSAMVVRDPEFTSPPLKGLYLLESSFETFPDAEDHQIKFGVELVNLDEMINNWSGKVYWRRLDCDRDILFEHRLEVAHAVVHDRPYDLQMNDWIRAGLEERQGDVQEIKQFWCSALIAFIYTELGFLPDNTPWSLITCKSFGSEPGDQIQLHFQNCNLEPVVLIRD